MKNPKVKTLKAILSEYEYTIGEFNSTWWEGLCCAAKRCVELEEISKKQADRFIEYLAQNRHKDRKAYPKEGYLWEIEDSESRIKWMKKHIKKLKNKTKTEQNES